jgi:hypothetical protein
MTPDSPRNTAWGVWIPDAGVVIFDGEKGARSALVTMRMKVPEWGDKHVLVRGQIGQWSQAE